MLSYIATPYWHRDPVVRAARAMAADHILADFIKRREPAFCPISHCAHMRHLLPANFEKWAVEYDLTILENCSKLVVALMPGYHFSKGVRREVIFANQRGIPIEFFDAKNILLAPFDHIRTLWEASAGPPGTVCLLPHANPYLELTIGNDNKNS